MFFVNSAVISNTIVWRQMVELVVIIQYSLLSINFLKSPGPAFCADNLSDISCPKNERWWRKELCSSKNLGTCWLSALTIVFCYNKVSEQIIGWTTCRILQYPAIFTWTSAKELVSMTMKQSMRKIKPMILEISDLRPNSKWLDESLFKWHGHFSA